MLFCVKLGFTNGDDGVRKRYYYKLGGVCSHFGFLSEVPN